MARMSAAAYPIARPDARAGVDLRIAPSCERIDRLGGAGKDKADGTRGASSPFRVGFLLFPELTQLDLTGPWEVFSGMPDTACHLIWKEAGPVVAGYGMTIHADTGFAQCPQLDLICIPGGRRG